MEDAKGYVWHFRFVIIHPGALSLNEPKNKDRAKLQHSYLVKLFHFYRKAFLDTKETQKSITLAIENEMSFLVVGV